jgi:hypothetical protein
MPPPLGRISWRAILANAGHGTTFSCRIIVTASERNSRIPVNVSLEKDFFRNNAARHHVYNPRKKLSNSRGLLMSLLCCRINYIGGIVSCPTLPALIHEPCCTPSPRKD